ncbi:MAG: circadian clock protein KaiC [Deferrisomatales bacterium]
MERVPTHTPHLDDVLHGGLPRGALVLLGGRSGTGKTLMALQWLFGNATDEDPGLYLTTLSEPREKLLRHLAGYPFFDPDAVGGRVRFGDLSEALLDGGPQAALDALVAALREHQPRYLVLDSFKALGDLARSPQEFRPVVFQLGAYLATLPVTALLLGEYSDLSLVESVEASVVDAIVYVRNEIQPDSTDARTLRVVKLRGSGFQAGEHPLWIDDNGVQISPRYVTPPDPAAYVPSTDRLSTGVAGLDELTGGGFTQGSATLFVGGPGTGKTTFCLHAVEAACRRGVPSLFVSFQEDPNQMARLFGELRGDATDEGVAPEFFYTSPVELTNDRHVQAVVRRAAATGAGLVAIDSLSDLRAAGSDRFLPFVYSLVQHFKDRRISLVMTLENSELFGPVRVSGLGLSYVADNLVLLRYVEEASELGKVLTVIKARGTHHSREIRRYEIDRQGVRVLDPVREITSLFSGAG